MCGNREGWDPVNWCNHIIRVAVVTPTDRRKSVRNRYVIDVWWCFRVVILLFGLFCWYNSFCNRRDSDLFLYIFYQTFEIFVICLAYQNKILLYHKELWFPFSWRSDSSLAAKLSFHGNTGRPPPLPSQGYDWSHLGM